MKKYEQRGEKSSGKEQNSKQKKPLKAVWSSMDCQDYHNIIFSYVPDGLKGKNTKGHFPVVI